MLILNDTTWIENVWYILSFILICDFFLLNLWLMFFQGINAGTKIGKNKFKLNQKKKKQNHAKKELRKRDITK